MLKLIAFDLDGTLTRGPTVCEAIAAHMGTWQSNEMRKFERAHTREEIANGRETMAGWYIGTPIDELLTNVRSIPLAPGTREAMDACRAANVTTVLLTITWTFAAEYFARELGFDYYAGTELHRDGTVSHFWPEDKADWIASHCKNHDLTPSSTAAIGDSWGDAHMLNWVGQGVYVGTSEPPVAGVRHRPNGSLSDIVGELLELQPH